MPYTPTPSEVVFCAFRTASVAENNLCQIELAGFCFLASTVNDSCIGDVYDVTPRVSVHVVSNPVKAGSPSGKGVILDTRVGFETQFSMISNNSKFSCSIFLTRGSVLSAQS